MRRPRRARDFCLAAVLLPMVALLLPADAAWSAKHHRSARRAKSHIMLVGSPSSSEHSHHHGSGGAYSGAFSGLKHGGGYAPFYGSPYYGSYFLGLAYRPNIYGPYSLPPLFAPADQMFGPGQMLQGIGNLGVDDFDGGVRQPRGVAKGAAQGAALGAAPGPANVDPPAKIKVRATNAAAKARAGKFLQAGDTQFGKQKFHQALERYREGSLAAPDLAECFFRQGFAQIAMGQYATAAKMFHRGLLIKSNWAESDFDLVALYGADHHLTQLSHREGLAQAIEQNPLDSGLLVAMGTLLYFDSERARSRVFFERAAQLGGNAERVLDGFLAPQPADAVEPAPGAPAGRERAAGRPAEAKF